MSPEELLSGIQALEERVIIAKREIEHISAFDKLQKRVWKLELEMEELQKLLKK
jgi:hypothetical protein